MAYHVITKNNKKSTLRLDGWDNVITGLGRDSYDKRLGAGVTSPERLTQRQLEDMYHSDDAARRIAEKYPWEMTRKWIRLGIEADDGRDSESNADLASDILKELKRLEAQPKFREALTWGNVYGGGLVLLGADDRGGSFEDELNEDRVQSIEYLNVFDRYEVDVDEFYVEPGPKFGKPKYFRLRDNATPRRGNTPLPEFNSGTRIHESRFIIFDGLQTSRRRRNNHNDGWGDSLYTAIWDTIRDYAQTWGSVAYLLQDYSQSVFKIQGLADALKSGEDDLVLNRFRVLNLMRSFARAIPLDAEIEEFKRDTIQFAGLDEVLDRMSERLAVAADMPLTVLIGRAPSGMNATGESDMRLFYDRVHSRQENKLQPQLERLVRLLFKSAKGPSQGAEPSRWEISFLPLWQLDEKEESERRKNQAEADKIYMEAGALAAEEVRQSRFGGAQYTVETMLDAAAREKEESDKEAKAEDMRTALAQAPAPDSPEGTDQDDERSDALHKVLFLDIDGVLVPAEEMRMGRERAKQTLEDGGMPSKPRTLRADPSSVRNLNRVLRLTGAEVVLSSSWRLDPGFEATKRWLAENGVEARVIGMTPDLGDRLTEIVDWLRRRTYVESWAAVDDNLPESSNIAQTTMRNGLDRRAANHLIEALGEEPIR